MFDVLFGDGEEDAYEASPQLVSRPGKAAIVGERPPALPFIGLANQYASRSPFHSPLFLPRSQTYHSSAFPNLLWTLGGQ